MGINVWQGGATAVAQIMHITPANVEVDDVFAITLGNDAGQEKQISFTATAATVQNVVEGLKALADAETSAPWSDVTVTEDDEKLIVTAKTAGLPFYIETSTTDGGGNDTQTLTASVETANSGPNDYNTPANFSEGSVPDAGDDVIFDSGSNDCLYGLDQSTVALSSFTVSRSYTGKIGQAIKPLQIDAPDVRIGVSTATGTPGGSGRINIDCGTTAAQIVVYATASSGIDTYKAPVRIKATNANTNVTVKSGTVGIATSDQADTSTIGRINSAGNVTIGSGVTLTELNVTAGTNVLNCAATTVSISGGTLTKDGSGAITTLNAGGGTTTINGSGTIATANINNGSAVRLNSSGTITNLNVSGLCDFTQDSTPRTVTTTKIYRGADLRCDLSDMTFTNGLEFVACDVSDCTLRLGRNYTLSAA